MSKGRRRGRPISSLQRRPGDREPKRCILIVCEGAKTEPLYFNSLRNCKKLRAVKIEVVGGDTAGSAPISIVDYAIELGKQRKREAQKSTFNLPFDEIWCVFDRENPQQGHTSFSRAIDKAVNNDLHMAVSTPAFEYWYLLHFEDTDKPFTNAEEVIRALEEHLPHYSKNQCIFEEIEDGTNEAVRRAHRIWENRPDPQDEFPNPSTRVYLLVVKLIKP